MEQLSSWETSSSWGIQEIPRTFLEPECSLPCSQQSITCPYPGSHQYRSRCQSCLLKIHFNIICTLRSSKSSLSLRFPPTKLCMYLSSSPCVPHVSPISFFFYLIIRIIFSGQYRSWLQCASLSVPPPFIPVSLKDTLFLFSFLTAMIFLALRFVFHWAVIQRL